MPGHDAPQSIAVLDFAISYLETLVAETKAAVDAGMSVEQTVAVVTMNTFQGYALWDWVHKTVNVPATYAELKGP